MKGPAPKKPPACDTCKARRVLCHPQQNGAPCPRCVDKGIACTTTPLPRGRPRRAPTAMVIPRALDVYRGPVFEKPGKCPDLNPDFVSHCFECLEYIPQYDHPLILSSGIKMTVRAVSFQVSLLPPDFRVLALAIVALASLVSFHEFVLGEGPRPEAYNDAFFFASCPNLVGCGVRRARTYRAIRTTAFKAAWEAGTMLQPSTENAASCYLLDLLEQSICRTSVLSVLTVLAADFCGQSRPWASAYMSHLRVLAPALRGEYLHPSDAGHWAAVFMAEATLSNQRRTPMLFTLNDQLMLYGPEPSSLDDMFASLQVSTQIPALSLLWVYSAQYLFHIPCLARELSDTINGDYARVKPLSERAVMRFLTNLSVLHSIISLLLDRMDEILPPPVNDTLFRVIDEADSVARRCVYAMVLAFASLVLPFYREIEERADPGTWAPERVQALRVQARDMAILGARVLVRGLRYLPALHYTPVHAETVLSWAEFCAEDADGWACVPQEGARDLETLLRELKLLGYSLDTFSAPRVAQLIRRLEGYVVASSRAPVGPEYYEVAASEETQCTRPESWADFSSFLVSGHHQPEC
ncbi:hypothetical protein B0H11DRAFT_2279609 [Mycena galericulata]|nr:hypothetical protein B0H11DRAFT_2279609 [Mycena galericulata]